MNCDPLSSVTPVPLMKKLLFVASGALRKERQIKDFGGQVNCHVVQDGRVKALRLDMAEALDPLLDRDQ